MTGYEYFEQVLKRKGLKPFDVSKGTGIRSGVFSDWKAGRYTPKADKMQLIADFLDVPVEPLLGVQTDAQSEYYYDNETLALAQELFENKQLHVLMDAAKDVDRESLAILYSLLLKMKKTNDE